MEQRRIIPYVAPRPAFVGLIRTLEIEMGKDLFKTKNVVTAEKGKVSTSTYDITGTTLEEVYNQIQSKGPTIDGKHYAGSTKCVLAGFDEGYEFASEADNGKFKGASRFNKAKLKFDCVITLPKFDDYKKTLSKEDQKTWEAYYSGVVAHENEHVADYEAEVTRWAADIAAMRGEAEAKDEKKAEAAAKAALGKEFKAAFTPANNEKRLKATAKKLDGSTGHGPVLKYTVSKP
jgi:predicted secreted Zn-dependent protease